MGGRHGRLGADDASDLGRRQQPQAFHSVDLGQTGFTGGVGLVNARHTADDRRSHAGNRAERPGCGSIINPLLADPLRPYASQALTASQMLQATMGTIGQNSAPTDHGLVINVGHAVAA
jgi:hypothetical protein